jgi:hypothetical protein
MRNAVDLKYANTVEEAWKHCAEGFEPVECAFGRESVVGPRVLDHHGQYSKNEAVSIKAAKLVLGGEEHYKFVVAGAPDHDQMYAIATLSRNIEANLDEATAVAEMDTDPIGRPRTSERYFKNLLFEQRTNSVPRNETGARMALSTLVDIYTRMQTPQEVEFALHEEERRKTEMLEKIIECSKGKVALAVSDERGFNEWYTKAPIIVLYSPKNQGITLGLNPKKGEPFFSHNGFDIVGENGFTTLYSQFDLKTGKPGSGGREVVGGSPRGVVMTREDAIKYYEVILNEISGRKK